ncbi:hypothetical protein B0J14DRAFT_489952, partial [Halenospora varia]
LGNGNSTTYKLLSDVSIFPDHGHHIRRVNGRNLCRYPDCKRCAASPEASTMHPDCFQLFIHEWRRDYTIETALDVLWIATAWRNPWRGAPDLRLQGKMDINIFLEKLPQLRLLPLELVQMIQNYSEPSLFSRFISVLDLVGRLSPAISDELVSVPLCEISTWQRGDRPTGAAASAGHIIRLTIDSCGIRKIESLPKNPPYSESRSHNMAFVIQEKSCLNGIIAWFKHGLLRLELLEASLGLQIWDTPTPPDLEYCTFYPANITASTCFRTIEMRETIGITFFFCRGKVYAIHAHTLTMPCAMTTLEHLSCRRQRTVAWVYIPISPSDQVVAFGTQLQRSDGHFFRTKLAGDIPIGPYHSGDTRDFILSKAPPMTLIYNTVDLQPISVIGAYSGKGHKSGSIAPFRHPTPDEPPFQDACFSSAPLEMVTRVQVFYNEENTYCRGILLEYENGAQQALGQCRLGVDLYKTCIKPSFLCFIHEEYLRPRTEIRLQAVRVEFTCEPRQNQAKDSWTWFTMTGTLGFWFTNEASHLSVTID